MIEVSYLGYHYYIKEDELQDELFDVYVHLSNIDPDNIAVFGNPPGC